MNLFNWEHAMNWWIWWCCCLQICISVGTTTRWKPAAMIWGRSSSALSAPKITTSFPSVATLTRTILSKPALGYPFFIFPPSPNTMYFIINCIKDYNMLVWWLFFWGGGGALSLYYYPQRVNFYLFIYWGFILLQLVHNRIWVWEVVQLCPVGLLDTWRTILLLHYW